MPTQDVRRSSTTFVRHNSHSSRLKTSSTRHNWQGKGVQHRRGSTLLRSFSRARAMSGTGLFQRRGSKVSQMPSGSRRSYLSPRTIRAFTGKIVNYHLKPSATSRNRSDSHLQDKQVTPVKTEIVAGRGKVRTLDGNRIEKQMGKWEILNLFRMSENPNNARLVEYLAPAITPLDDKAREELFMSRSAYMHKVSHAGDDTEFPVAMNNVVPSGKFLDVKLGQIINRRADKVHGKQQLGRILKRPLHLFKQKIKRSAVTIQNHPGGLAREIDELRGSRMLAPLLKLRAGINELPLQERGLKLWRLNHDLGMLRSAVRESDVGLVGASVLISLQDEDRPVTLIDVENCILPDDPEVSEEDIFQCQKAFIDGINAMIAEIDILRSEIEKELQS